MTPTNMITSDTISIGTQAPPTRMKKKTQAIVVRILPLLAMTHRPMCPA